MARSCCPQTKAFFEKGSKILLFDLKRLVFRPNLSIQVNKNVYAHELFFINLKGYLVEVISLLVVFIYLQYYYLLSFVSTLPVKF